KAVDEYPGMYSRNGVKAMPKVVTVTKKIADSISRTNTLSRVNLNERRSSNVSSFNITSLYLLSSFLAIGFFSFLFVAFWTKLIKKTLVDVYVLLKLLLKRINRKSTRLTPVT